MRFKHYIKEDRKEDLQALDDLHEIWMPRIKKECKKWLKETDYKPLWRGANISSDKYIQVKKVRQDRKSVDMDKGNQKLLDKLFMKKFGWKPRSQGMFCTPEWTISATYGYPGVIFVPGNYKYIWSETIQDLYGRILRIYDKTGREKGDVLEEAELQKLVDCYIDNNLKKAFNNVWPEITVKCKEYIFVSKRLVEMEYRRIADFMGELR